MYSKNRPHRYLESSHLFNQWLFPYHSSYLSISKSLFFSLKHRVLCDLFKTDNGVWTKGIWLSFMDVIIVVQMSCFCSLLLSGDNLSYQRHRMTLADCHLSAATAQDDVTWLSFVQSSSAGWFYLIVICPHKQHRMTLPYCHPSRAAAQHDFTWLISSRAAAQGDFIWLSSIQSSGTGRLYLTVIHPEQRRRMNLAVTRLVSAGLLISAAFNVDWSIVRNQEEHPPFM